MSNVDFKKVKILLDKRHKILAAVQRLIKEGDAGKYVASSLLMDVIIVDDEIIVLLTGVKL